MGGMAHSKKQHQQHQHPPQQKQDEVEEELSPSCSGGSGGGGVGRVSGSASHHRTRQMLHNHLAARRSGGSRSRRSQLQANLYQFLGSRQNSGAANPPPPLPPPPPTQQPMSASCGVGGGPRRPAVGDRELERRRLLLDAIGTLKRLSTDCRDNEDDANKDVQQAPLKSGSNSAWKPADGGEGRQSQPPPQESSAAAISEQLRQLSDSLRYLTVACRIRRRPTATSLRRGEDADAAGCRDGAEVELGQKIGATRDLLAKMLRRSGGCGGGGGSGGGGGGGGGEAPTCRARFAPDLSVPASATGKGERPFWRCPVHLELERRQRRQRQPPPQPSLPPLPTPPSRRSRADSVKQQVSRSKDTLLGDPVFNVSCAGMQYKWGQMTLPTISDHIPNSADALGRANLHRRRTLERRQSALAELREFAGRVEDKWEAIEETRIDRAIDAACQRLRRTIKSRGKRGRRRCRDSLAKKSTATKAPFEGANGAVRNGCSDNGSIQWGI